MHSKEDKPGELGRLPSYFPFVEEYELKCIKCKKITKVSGNTECIYHDGAKYWPGYHTCCKCLKECVNDR